MQVGVQFAEFLHQAFGAVVAGDAAAAGLAHAFEVGLVGIQVRDGRRDGPRIARAG